MTETIITPAEDICPAPGRVDGLNHSWGFDGDDPYIVCRFCGEMRDAIGGAVLRAAVETREDPADTATRVLIWAWREQLPLDQLARALHDLTGAAVGLHEVDTGSDQYAIVLTTKPMTAGQAKAVYDRHQED